MQRPRSPYLLEFSPHRPRLPPGPPYHFRGHNLPPLPPPPREVWWDNWRHPYHHYSAPLPPPLFPRPPTPLVNPVRGQWGRVGRGTIDRKVSQVFSCQACNREYKSQETYQEHVRGHVKVCANLIKLSCFDIGNRWSDIQLHYYY